MRARSAALLAAVTLLAAFAAVGSGSPAGPPATLRAPDPPAGVSLAPREAVASDAAAPGIPATVTNLSLQKQTISYPTYSPDGSQIGTTSWRVVRGSGNCCENHLAAAASGRLVDFGGTYLVYSDDQGNTWKRVAPVEPFVGGEGTVSVAPGGDIVGLAWDVYSGDRVLAFKMDGATGQWSYMYTPLHAPGFDRPWLSIVPGPHTIAGQTVPYISLFEGGVLRPSNTHYVSLDGLHYTAVTTSTTGTVSRWLDSSPVAQADWIQPITESGVTPLNGGGAIAFPVYSGTPGWRIFDTASLSWKPFTLGDGSSMPPGHLAMDSKGWAHLVSLGEGNVTYRLSKDGGRTWTSVNTALPPNHSIENWDFRVNGELGITAVGLHTHNSATSRDRDLVLKYATACGQPELTRFYQVGNADLNASSGLGANVRFDFATTVILSDGRVATSLIDAAHTAPALAVEMQTTLTPGYTPPLLSCGVPAP
jgi:hypothetical protein